jgi:Cu(I)/Ag(I) efflux system protein CusF
MNSTSRLALAAASALLTLASVAHPAASFAEGEVKKVDRDAGKVAIRHGELNNMPPMTMVFRVKDPAMLEQVKAGDRIRFAADKVGGAFTVMQLEKSD